MLVNGLHIAVMYCDWLFAIVFTNVWLVYFIIYLFRMDHLTANCTLFMSAESHWVLLDVISQPVHLLLLLLLVVILVLIILLIHCELFLVFVNVLLLIV